MKLLYPMLVTLNKKSHRDLVIVVKEYLMPVNTDREGAIHSRNGSYPIYHLLYLAIPNFVTIFMPIKLKNMGIFDNFFGKEETNIALEIERKFLVTGNFKPFSIDKIDIVQGYLSTDPERTVRVRIASDQGFITIKGASDATGTTRVEWEHAIPVKEARELLKLCMPHPIEKTRYVVEIDEYIIEVDEFHGVNEGLIVAEIELAEADEEIPTPDWFGMEVTSDHRYYNAYLSQHPFTQWTDK